MIQSVEQLKETQEALASVERAFAHLRRDMARMHPSQYALMAEGDIENIRRLRCQIDEYLGLSFTPAEPFAFEKSEVQ